MERTVITEKPMQQDEIDLSELVRELWAKIWWILGATFVCLTMSAIYAFFIAKPVYVSSALLLPTQSVSSGDLGAAAAFLGKKSSATGGDLDLYQSLLTSRTVIQKVLRDEFKNESDTGKGRSEPLFEILGIDSTKNGAMDDAVSALSKAVFVGSRESGEGGILEVKVSAGSPWLAQQIGTSVLSIGQEELRVIRIERSKVVMSRVLIAVNLAKTEWDSAARALTWYKDRNRSIQLPEQILALSRLEIEKQAKEQKYLLARKEYENQMLEQIKAAPPMMILDPANRPSRKSKPKRSLILAIGVIVGVMTSSITILLCRSLIRTEPSV